MMHLGNVRFGRRPNSFKRLAFPAICLGWSLLLPHFAQADSVNLDPVEAVKQTLDEGGDPTEDVKKLQTLGEMGRALLQIRDWKSYGGLIENLVHRLQDGIHKALGGNDTDKEAASILVKGMAGNEQLAKSENPLVSQMLTDERLVNDLGEATKSSNPRVSQAAVQALGSLKIEPTDNNLSKLKEWLKAPQASSRQAAASVLAQMVNRGAYREPEGVNRIVQILKIAALGLSDSDNDVKKFSLQAIQNAAKGAYSMLGEGKRSETKKLTPKDLEDDKQKLDTLKPVLIFFEDQSAALVEVAKTKDASLRVIFLQTFEEVAKIRFRVFQWSSVSPPGILESLENTLRTGLPSAVEALGDKDPKVRLAAAQALELMVSFVGPEGTDSERAAKGLIASLDRAGNDVDDQMFVSWCSARALGKMAPAHAEWIVPPLAEAVKFRGLDEENVFSSHDQDLRLAAASALQQYGPRAKKAVPILAEILRSPESFKIKLTAIETMASIGVADSDEAIDSLVTALSEETTSVRLSAAKLLGRLGSLKEPIRKKMAEKLDDPDPEVRQAISEALLSANQPK